MRHGKTDWNLLHKLQGQTDIPLNDMGRKMAREAGERYKDIHFDVCYCSPLVRARETARLVLEGRDVPVIIDDRLAEMGFGIYEGTEEEFRELFSNPFDIRECFSKRFIIVAENRDQVCYICIILFPCLCLFY